MRPVIVFGGLALLHTLVQTSLLSPFLFPLSAAFVMSTIEPRILLLLISGTILEFFSSLPPGLLLISMLTPLAAQLVFGKMTPQFSWRFLLVAVAVTLLQVIVIVSVPVITYSSSTLALPSILWLAGGTALTSFLGAAFWHEYE
ncbi:MAG: hypothetical protein HYR90_03555 [Candidatus Andersenbacteria bacterium]|nr:hypothetical protein [Candidatus Andersenbacteria bacterium]MBI3250342.1 hypothetical protein [Candidatus Andersenbacteria bacterium]